MSLVTESSIARAAAEDAAAATIGFTSAGSWFGATPSRSAMRCVTDFWISVSSFCTRTAGAVIGRSRIG
jgi:hypothetical protein